MIMTMEGNKKKYLFKTNINCSGCLATVSPFLNAAEGIVSWTVDITNKDKVLTVHPDGISPEGVVEVVKKSGFKIEALD